MPQVARVFLELGQLAALAGQFLVQLGKNAAALLAVPVQALLLLALAVEFMLQGLPCLGDARLMLPQYLEILL